MAIPMLTAVIEAAVAVWLEGYGKLATTTIAPLTELLF
jgi:hypothetical protein